MGLFIAISVILIMVGLWNIMIAYLSRFPQNLSTTTAILTKSDTVRNVHGKRGLIPIWTTYTYTYTVNGKQYKYYGQNWKHKKHLRPRIKLVYFKYFPRHACQNKFYASVEWVIGIFYLTLGILLLFIMPI